MLNNLFEKISLLKKDFSLKSSDDIFYFKFVNNINGNILFLCQKEYYKIIISIKSRILQYAIMIDPSKIIYQKSYILRKFQVNSQDIHKILSKEVSKANEYVLNKPLILLGVVTIYGIPFNLDGKYDQNYSELFYEELFDSEYRVTVRKLLRNDNKLNVINESYSRLSVWATGIKINTGVPHVFAEYGSSICNIQEEISIEDYSLLVMKNTKIPDFEGSVFVRTIVDKKLSNMEIVIRFKGVSESITIQELPDRQVIISFFDGRIVSNENGMIKDYKTICKKINFFILEVLIKNNLTKKFKMDLGIEHNNALSKEEVETVKMMFY